MTCYIKNAFLLAGTFMAFLIGSGFATGQEVLQYFASYGLWGILGAIIVYLILLYVVKSFLLVGYKEHFIKQNDIFKFYGGKLVGTFYDYFAIIVTYTSFIAMIAGAGATLHQHYDLPIFVGAILIGSLALFTVLLGLKNVIKVLGNIGPFNVGIVLIFSVIAIMTGNISLYDAHYFVKQAEILRASTNWLFASFSYIGICLLWLAPFLAALGKNFNSIKEVKLGCYFGVTGFICAVLLLIIALLCNIEDVFSSMIPALFLAKKIHTIFGIVFLFFIIIGTFTASVPLLWMTSSRIFAENTKQFKIITIFLALIGIFIGLKIPFSIIVNSVYVLNGYVGIGLLFLVIIKDIKQWIL